jgi:hypothetical protein
MGPVKNGVFHFWIFFNEIGTSVDGHNNLKVSLKSRIRNKW